MHTCINCNRKAAERAGDTFTCERCGYTWDVAHEQANAAYLLAQGRRPAPPLAEAVDDAQASLDAELGFWGPAPVEDGESVTNVTVPGAAFVEVINAPEDGETVIELDALEQALADLLVRDLDALADLHNVEVNSTARKDDKIAALMAAEVLTLVYNAETGEASVF